MHSISLLVCIWLLTNSLHGLHNPIDVIIPCHEKDLPTLSLAIKGIKQNGNGVRRVIVISATKFTNDAEWFDEARFPFTKKDITLMIFNQNEQQAQDYMRIYPDRVGWVYQQLLKLYAGMVIPDISSNVLALDSDTIFLRSVSFIDNQGYALYNVGTEHHRPYFEHMSRLLPRLNKVYAKHSGISHHMLFQRHILKDLFQDIEAYHQMEPWQALCVCIDKGSFRISEYEIYFNYIVSRNYKVKIRPLKYKDMKFDIKAIAKRKKQNYAYVSCHSYRSTQYNYPLVILKNSNQRPKYLSLEKS